tara:strand:- start:271 stop:756 length:486 start_codon:yes stop_codon:yes gene_type:complete
MAYREFTKKEKDILDELTEDFRSKIVPVASKVNELCTDEDCSVRIQSGYRSTKDQLKHYKVGRKKRGDKWVRTGDRPVITYAKPGHSPHEYRLAVHIVLLNDNDRRWLSDKDERWHTIVGKTVREAGGLTWGGDFSKIFDAAHVEDPKWRDVARDLDWRGL